METIAGVVCTDYVRLNVKVSSKLSILNFMGYLKKKVH